MGVQNPDIQLWGVGQNNLKSVDVSIKVGSFTCLCGPSGSGKSSLAFDVLYAEGQRRYVESLSNYTKQFLKQVPRPTIEGSRNIPPAICIEQKNTVFTSRSCVGSTTEVLDYLRLIFEQLCEPHCPEHKIPLTQSAPTTGAKKLCKLFNKKRLYILSPLPQQTKITHLRKLLKDIQAEGFLRILIKPQNKPAEVLQIQDLDSKEQKKLLKQSLYVVIDRLAASPDQEGRMFDSISQAYQNFLIHHPDATGAKACIYCLANSSKEDPTWHFLGEEPTCHTCNYQGVKATASLFNFNSPLGACPECKGFGNHKGIDEKKVVPNPELTIEQGCLKPFNSVATKSYLNRIKKFCASQGISTIKPWNKLTDAQKKLIWKGSKGYEGVEGFFAYVASRKHLIHMRVLLARYQSLKVCGLCKGSRLNLQAHNFFLNGKSFHELSDMSIDALSVWLKKLKLTKAQKAKCPEAYTQLLKRMHFLQSVGVGYLGLNRLTNSLSGGEFQRLKIARQLGTGLSRSLYVLDEPTIGLHMSDNQKLIEALQELQRLGNTLVVVEHDRSTLQQATHIIEMGPESGSNGGKVMFSGTRAEFLKTANSNTVGFLSGPAPASTPKRSVSLENQKYFIQLKGAKGHNLKSANLSVPLKRLVVMAGVSGSGKSSIVTQSLYPALLQKLSPTSVRKQALSFDSIEGYEHIDNLCFIESSSIAQTKRACVATYMEIFVPIRKLLAEAAAQQGYRYGPGFFSLNVEGGRCSHCEGLGYEEIDMVFMDNIRSTCKVCHGIKFTPEALAIKWNSKNVHDILNMQIDEAWGLFEQVPIKRALKALREVGLGYLKIGQGADTLSGGEAQRIKLAHSFCEPKAHKRCLFILDEPTRGLHFKEVNTLMKVLSQLVDAGNSVLIIEHNEDVILQADWIIEMGPGAGPKGGKIIAQSTPWELLNNPNSPTGQSIKAQL